MTPFEKFMLQAQGRDPDLEEKLRAEQFRNIERYFRIVFGRSLRPDERQLVESIASALNTSVDDEYVMQIFIAGRGLEASHKLAEEVSDAKEAIIQTNGEQKKLYAKQSARDSWLIWACYILLLASIPTNVWIVRNVLHLSDRMDLIGSATER
ncbi:hypothetical protein MCBMB27_00938 [Methylobacterium phyllosphaerae]|uniref:Uncharacterized protein n=2 Tax=Methylobacterium TaxID=407 RepID=A0AAE8L5G5_9HYPH|nr:MULTISPECIES: hypothetical protein [Methylobacterium]AIQ89359.1 protein of unassigned function [Methylobacterium oryzae CBMB20]APT30229.1 hypothetical protein MCBMB27_00938 [Methylobacterium phyllosphaerae]SFG53375.1 hypothetical protein SAMN05192567_104222 [Methylobacterium phyllosphaerae]